MKLFLKYMPLLLGRWVLKIGYMYYVKGLEGRSGAFTVV